MMIENTCPQGHSSFHDQRSDLQYPLHNAFALTIDKTQSLSLHSIVVSMDSSLFTVGQAYAALSRATSISGLSIMHSSSTMMPSMSTNYWNKNGTPLKSQGT